MNLYTHQESNTRRTWALLGALFVFIIGVGWVLSYVYNDQSILFAAVVLSVIMNVLSFWFSDSIVLSLYHAKKVERGQLPDLWNITENLSITAGLPMPRIYIIEDDQPNAFATGRNKENATIAVTTGLLSILDRSELEGVIAHELAHIGNKDILLQTVVVIAVGALSLLADMFLRGSFAGNDREGRAGGILAVIGIILIILSPIIGTIIQLAISRKREYLADATGALLTRYPEGLASALQKISSYKKEMKVTNHATAHLFIASPLKGRDVSGFIGRLFMTHPPIEDRIKRLRK